MKWIKYILIWIGLMVYLFVMLAFVGKEQENILCRRVSINIHDSLEVGFVTSEEIMKIINPNPASLLGKPVRSVNISQLEDKLHKIRSIRSAEVYYDVEGHLKVDIHQRKPMVRIIDNSGASYCIDNEAYLIPMDGRFVPHILIVNGHTGTIDSKARNINDLDNNEILMDAYRLCQYLNKDEFLRAQIVQVYVTSKKEFELIPRVGSHVILLGEVDGFEARLDNLRTLYEQGFSTMGWNRFEIINLKYVNQVVCTKR
jgi:cell division protein FtsQ